MLSRITLIILLLLCVGHSPPALAEFTGYESLSDWQSLCRSKSGTVTGLASSYDRTGRNYDFNYYQDPEGFQTEVVDPVTAATITGPGVLTRFWMPHASANAAFNIRMYVDGALDPAIDTDSNLLLGGDYGYFDSPLVSTLLGGQVSYEPIIFSQSLRIETNNFEYLTGAHKRNYYQYSYHKLPAGEAVTSYTGTLTPAQQTARDIAVDSINNVGQNPAGDSAGSTVISTGTASIDPGQAIILSDLTGTGLIRQLNVKMDTATDADLDGLRVRVRYDGAAENAVDVPVAHFFGAGHERIPYQSLPLGTDSPEGFYSYWPMPFRKAAVVELYNTTGSAITIDSAAVEYEAGPVPTDALYFHGIHNEELTAATQDYHIMLDVEGAGHYVGNLLYVQRDGTDRSILESDDIITVDGQVLYGTGLEDAYNGGFYYNHVMIRTDDGDLAQPEAGIKPFHGLLHMDDQDFGDTFLRTDQYRWLISDYVPFSDGIEVKIENIGGGADVLFGSSVFYYLRPELPGDVTGDNFVGADDLVAILTNWGLSPANRDQGDLTGDGLVGADDYVEVLTYWGSGYPSEPLPEPATLGLLLIAGSTCLVKSSRDIRL